MTQNAGVQLNVVTPQPVINPDDIKGVVFTKVASVEENAMRFSIPHKHYDIVIKGRMKSSIVSGYVADFTITNVLPDDWEYLTKKYGKGGVSQHPSFVNGRIFAQKDEFETVKRAQDSETKEISKSTGTVQLDESDLVASTLPSDGESPGITKAKAKSAK
jgi:hypothetical protein